LIVTAWLFGVSNNYFSSIEQIFSGGAIINGLISFLHWYLYLSLIFFALKALKIEFKVKELWVAIFTGNSSRYSLLYRFLTDSVGFNRDENIVHNL
ncbi:MAG: hypothetical protein ACTSP3_15435, partial [Candidatus Heimdallarchaeaceae archaeon]